MGDLNASAAGLAIVVALMLALFLLKQEEDSNETPDDSARSDYRRAGGSGRVR
jgi:hypothetical protein